jgi:hypothetical protein
MYKFEDGFETDDAAIAAAHAQATWQRSKWTTDSEHKEEQQ